MKNTIKQGRTDEEHKAYIILITKQARDKDIAFCHRPLETLRCGDKLDVKYYLKDGTKVKERSLSEATITRLGRDRLQQVDFIEVARFYDNAEDIESSMIVFLNDPNNLLKLKEPGKGYCHLVELDKAREDAKKLGRKWHGDAYDLKKFCEENGDFNYRVNVEMLQFLTDKANRSAIAYNEAYSALQAILAECNEEFI